MRIIQSPGVQITEKDLSLRANMPAGTTILVTGFANQGPVSEPIMVTSTSEFESIYGTPTTAAERYFYYTCKEALNSPCVLTTLRLPYGTGEGSDVGVLHTALFYPMVSADVVDPVLGTFVEWTIGVPSAFNLTDEEYEIAQTGNINWGDLADGSGDASASTDPNGASLFNAGFAVLNDIRAVVNEMSEGYYFGLTDNKAVLSSTSPDFDSIRSIQTITGTDSSNLPILDQLPEERLDFALSATSLDSEQGVSSVSEALEKVGFVGFETDYFRDHVSVGLFKVRRSILDPAYLTVGTTERYLGSFDFNRKQANQSGGRLVNSFIEDIINTSSPTFKFYINPTLSKDYIWSSQNSSNPLARVTVADDAKALYPVGTYSPDTRSAEETKIIGSLPLKLDRALRTLEAIDDITIDIVVDGGLSTIYATTQAGPNISFDDEKFIADPQDPGLIQDWSEITNKLVNFAQNIRKDCFAIIDPLRQTFVNGKDTKTMDLKTKSFTQDMYTPLRKQASIESSYATMYANWLKITDMFTQRKMWLPFSGYAAAIMAKADAVLAPWAAPAGLTRGTFLALDIAFNPNQKQRDRLYEIGVNPVVFFNGDGFVVMGQKTLQKKPSAFDRINVRRLFLFLERAVQRTVKYYVFEPNTAFTRSSLVTVITPIFDYAKSTSGLYDYLIVADDRNNTPSTIDENELIVDIYIKPVRTAEFILVNFIATRTNQNFTELM